MTSEQNRTQQGLQLAIQMEKDGKVFYQKASENTQHQLGKKLLATLAGEEDSHLQKFQQIYESLRRQKDWPSVEFKADHSKSLKTLFSSASRQEELTTMGSASEIDTVEFALDMEAKSYDLYQRQAKVATAETEKKFYLTVAAEEREHQISLNEYREYLKDPAAWFIVKDERALDRG